MSPAPRLSPHEPAPRPWPWRGLFVAAALALGLHLVVFGWLPLGVGVGWHGGAAPRLRVRPIVAVPAAAAPAVETAPQQAPAGGARVAMSTAATRVAVPVPMHAASMPADTAVPAARDAEQPAASAPAPAADTEGGGRPLPTYATQPAPGVAMQFELRRAGLSGQAELIWRRDGERYDLQLGGSAFGRPILAWHSEGGFDAFGLAPSRFVDQRRSRDAQAANFQRDKGLITYSGPAIEHPLVAGAQDRLSWLLQLAGIVAADPAAYEVGAQISMFVAGARGDADVWTFGVESRESLDVAEGRVERALKLVREPRKTYDTRVEVWLDPARHFLPVKLRLLQPRAGDGFEFSLQNMTELR